MNEYPFTIRIKNNFSERPEGPRCLCSSHHSFILKVPHDEIIQGAFRKKDNVFLEQVPEVALSIHLMTLNKYL